MHNRQRMRQADDRRCNDNVADDMACAAGVIRAVIWGLLIWAAGAWALCLVLS